MKIGEIILKIQRMNMNAGIMRKEDPKKYWLIIARLIMGGLFFFSMFFHFWNGANAFVYNPSIWLYVVVFIGFIIAYYALEFSNNNLGNFIFKLHSIFALIHFISLLWFVINNGFTIRFWAFLQLFFILIMIVLAFFSNLFINLIFGSSSKPKRAKKVKEIKEVDYVDDKNDLKDADFVEVEENE